MLIHITITLKLNLLKKKTKCIDNCLVPPMNDWCTRRPPKSDYGGFLRKDLGGWLKRHEREGG